MGEIRINILKYNIKGNPKGELFWNAALSHSL